MELNKILNTRPSSPYWTPPPLHVHVLAERESARVVSWEFGIDSAEAKITKINKVVAITDGHTVSKVTLFEELRHKLEEKNYIIKNYHLKGDTPPLHIMVSKKTNFFKSSPVELTCEGLPEAAKALLFPSSKVVKLMEWKGVGGLLTVEGQVVQVSNVKKIRSGSGDVPLRQITLKQGDVQAHVSLWREATTETPELGANVQISHLRGCKDQLQSTGHTTIESETLWTQDG
nr:uncharacterized protein LOC129154838 [Nothobranchius furzeri]